MAILAYNIKLDASEAQLKHWRELLSQAAQAYDLCSQITHEKKLPYSRVAIHNECYDTLRKRFPTLSSQQVIRVQCEVCSAYKSRRSNKHKGDIPQKHGLSMTLDKRLYANLTPTSVCLTGGEKGKRDKYGFITYAKLDEMFRSYPTKDPTVFMRGGELFLTVPFEVQVKPCVGDNAVGVDLGMRRLFVTSEGNAFSDKEYLKRRRRVRYLKRCLQSKNTRSAKRHSIKLRRHERNMSKDMVCRAVNALVGSTSADALVLEDLSKIKERTSKHKGGKKRTAHNRAFSQVPLHYFKERLSQKAALLGKRVQTVSPTYTSQTDSRTGKRDGQRIGCRYVCSDGVVLDADWNAAINIAQRASHPFSKCLPVDGGINFLRGRAPSAARTPRAETLRGKPTRRRRRASVKFIRG